MAKLRKKNRSPVVTAGMAGQMKWLYYNTDLNQAQIAARFDVNQGRVSEVITEAVYAEVLPIAVDLGDVA